MALFLQILDGDTPATAKPVFASRDPYVLRAVVLAMSERLAPEIGPTILKLAPTKTPRRRKSGAEPKGGAK